MLILDRTLDPDARTLINRMTVHPTRERADLVNCTIRRLKDAHVWPKLDLMQMYAAHTEQAAQLNWRGSSATASAVSSPTFNTDYAYVTDGSSSYIDTNFNLTTAGIQFARNDCYFGAWFLNDPVPTGTSCGEWDGSDGIHINNNTPTNDCSFRINQAGSTNGAASSGAGRGLWGASRTGSTSGALRQNGAGKATTTVASTAVNNLTLQLGRTRSTNFSNVTIWWGGCFAGKSLTAAEETLLYTITRDYLVALGVTI